MVRRRWRYLLAGVLATFLLLASAMVWLLGTEAGARLALAAASRLSAGAFQPGEVTGTLTGRLTLRQSKVARPGWSAALEELHLRWHPGELFRGHLQVEELSLRGMELRLPEAQEKEKTDREIDLSFPAADRLPRLSGSVGKLHLSRLRVRRPGEEDLRIEEFSARLAWDRPEVRLEEVRLLTPAARLAGTARADLAAPSLDLRLQAELPEAAAGLDEVVLEATLRPLPGGRHLAGPVSLRGAGGGAPRLIAEASFDWSADRLRLESLQISRPDAAGEVRGRLEVSGGREAAFRLFLQAEKVDLYPLIDFRTDLAAEVEAAGTLAEYSGRFRLASRGRDWRGLQLSSPLSGSLEGISFPGVEGEWLGGRLLGRVAAQWRQTPALELHLAGERLDPEKISADWPGRIAFRLDLAASRTAAGPLQAEIDGELRDSRLRGEPLTGAMQATLRGEDLRIARLVLQGEGFDLQARGGLQERIGFRARVDRLSALIPQARGRLQAQGWVRWRDRHLSGAIDAGGGDLAIGGLQVESFTARGEHAGKGAPFRVTAAAGGLVHGELRLTQAALTAAGRLERHTFEISLSGPEVELRGAARGGYAKGLWRGTVTSLAGREERFGRWQLEEATRIAFSARSLRVETFELAGPAGARLQGGADLAFEPLRGEASAEWREIDLSLINPWLKKGSLAGQTSGEAALRLSAADRMEIRARAEGSGALTLEGERIGISRAAAAVTWDAGGLQGTVDLLLAGGGEFAGAIRSSEPARPTLPAAGAAQVRWRRFDLSLLAPWLPEIAVAGETSGSLEGEWGERGERLNLAGKVEMFGDLRYREAALQVRRAALDLAWNAGGLRAGWDLRLAEGGRWRGTVTSAAPARLAIPQQGEVEARWEGIDLALLRPWMPSQMLLEGELAGELAGEWGAGGEVDLAGRLAIVGGELQWEAESGVIASRLREAEFDWRWWQETLAGDLTLTLEDFGRAKGTFTLPLPARLPPKMQPAGAVRGELAGSLKEEGLLTAIFPGLVQETSGLLSLDLRVGGTWEAPELGGEFRLADAGAYLPAAGIRLREIALEARLQGEEVRVESLQVRSGPGRIAGSAVIRLDNWRLREYSAKVQGERFQVVNLPELLLFVSPDLEIEGDRERLAVRGQMVIPEALVRGREEETPVTASPDVVIVDAPAPEAARELPLALDIQVRILLGESVLVKAEGLDARLEGNVRLTVKGAEAEQTSGQGEIRVTQGHYATYGVKLRIVRGTVLFAGGPIDQPTLDILALRTVGEVKAGVRVTGTPRRPVVNLYSEPTLADTDILAYIVLGRPLGERGGDAGLLMTAAGALLSKGESAVLQDRLKRTFGLDVLEVEAGSGEAAGSQITIGKYLSPDLYISFGRALFANTSEVRMRYSLGERWQLESSVGDESGVDLFYRIEFR